MSNKRIERRMNWHLYELMAAHQIRTAVDLQHKLALVGVTISRSQLARLMIQNPKRLSSELMYGLTEVFQCSTNELWSNPNKQTLKRRAEDVRSMPQSKEKNASSEREERTSSHVNKSDDIGPPARAFKYPSK